jgi:hypothetical protein
LWVDSGTIVLFPRIGETSIFIDEQFWGRAARASGDSQESGAPVKFLGASLGASRDSHFAGDLDF